MEINSLGLEHANSYTCRLYFSLSQVRAHVAQLFTITEMSIAMCRQKSSFSIVSYMNSSPGYLAIGG